MKMCSALDTLLLLCILILSVCGEDSPVIVLHENSIALGSPTSSLTAMKMAVTTAVTWWPKFTAALTIKDSTSIVKELKGDGGFEYFEGSALLDHVEDLDKEYVPEYMALLLEQLDVPQDKQSAFAKHLNLLPHLRKNEFAVYDVAYSMDTGGSCKYVCIVMSNDAVNNTSTFLVANIKAQFHLAPDVMVISKTVSRLGGLYSDVSVSHEYMHNPVKTTDINSVFQFFQIAAFKKFSDLMGLSVDNPSISQ